MFHLVGMAVVTAAGVAAANIDQWPKLKQQATAYIGDVIRTVKQEFADASRPSAEQQQEAKSNIVESAPLPVTLERLQTRVLTKLEEEGSRSRLGLSSLMVILAITAKMGVGWLMPVSLLLTGFLASPIFERAAFAVFKEKKPRVDVVDATGIALCILFQRFAIAAGMVWLLTLGEWLLDYARKRSYQSLHHIFGEQVRTAWLLRDGVEIEVPVDTLIHGDLIVVNTGEQIPVDGTIVKGEAMIDQQRLTGESVPVGKHLGEEVFAMTAVVAGRLTISVSQTGEQTVASRIIRIIDEASHKPIALQSAGERFADSMVLPTFGLGALGLITTGSGAMLAIVNADYGTGIRVADPIAMLASLGKAAQHGVLVKDSRVFEVLPDVDVVLFDKTGTLTGDVPVVSAIIPHTHSEDTILAYTAAVEQHFSHPIAKAVLHKARQLRLSLPTYDETRYEVGLGIEAVIDHDHVRVGSSRYMETVGIPIPDAIRESLDYTREQGHTAIVTAINHRVAGMIELQSTIRTEAFRMIRGLRKRGMREIVLISGDHEGPTRELAQRLRVNRYFAGVLPHEKAGYIRMLQQEGKTVMMVGDGINDSAALSCADISVSLHGASTIAMDVADVVFMDGNLEKFDYLFQYSEALAKNVRRSFQLIAIPNTVCILGALVGVLGLSGSLVLNNGFNVISALNGMSLYDESEKK